MFSSIYIYFSFLLIRIDYLVSAQQEPKGTPLGVLRAGHLLGVSSPPGLVLELTFHTGDTEAMLGAHLKKSGLRELL